MENAEPRWVRRGGEQVCMTLRVIKKPGSKTVTVAMRGAFEADAGLRESFYRMLGV